MGNYYRSGYHSHQPNWRNRANLRGKYIGIEFECISNTDSYRDLLAALPDVLAPARRPITESDGSLCNMRGVEIVFPPVSYRQIKNANSVFAKSVAALEGKINPNSRFSTGMHMNVNTRGWSDRKIQLFVATFHLIPSAWLTRIGGRNLNGYCRQYHYSFISDYARIGGHCYAAEVRSNRVELRFPKSTTDKKSIHDLVDFIDVVESFAASVTSNLMSSKVTPMFSAFLGKTKKGRQVYKALTGEEYSVTVNPKGRKSRSKSVDSSASPAQCVSPSTAASPPGVTAVSTWGPDGSETVHMGDQLGELFTTTYVRLRRNT